MNVRVFSGLGSQVSKSWPMMALVVLYALVVGIAMMFHAMWRDEVQAWLIARDSADLLSLFHNLHYEGHASLWYLLMMPLTRISADPSLMQVLQFVIAVSVVVTVLWWAPFSGLEKGLFPFGYYTLYEYGVKSRGYALGCLLLFVLCTLWPRRRSHPVTVSLVLALLANVDILWMIVSIAAVIALAVDRSINQPAEEDGLRKVSWPDLLALVIIGVGWALAVATSMPPSDTGIAVGWFLDFSMERLEVTLGALSVVLSPARSVLIDMAVAAILFIAGRRARNDPPAAIFFAISAIGLLTFFYTKYPDHEWHRGLIWIALVAAVWIDRRSLPDKKSLSTRKSVLPPMLFAGILVCQAYAGVKAVWIDLRQPLSRGRDVAHFIAANGWAKDPIIGLPDHTTVSIVGYLCVERAYYANGRRWGSFTIWDQLRRQPVDLDHVLDASEKFGSSVTWVSSVTTPIDRSLLGKHGFLEVGEFLGARDSDENFVVFRRTAKGDGRPPPA